MLLYSSMPRLTNFKSIPLKTANGLLRPKQKLLKFFLNKFFFLPQMAIECVGC